jgi:hypothetical protein
MLVALSDVAGLGSLGHGLRPNKKEKKKKKKKAPIKNKKKASNKNMNE